MVVVVVVVVLGTGAGTGIQRRCTAELDPHHPRSRRQRPAQRVSQRASHALALCYRCRRCCCCRCCRCRCCCRCVSVFFCCDMCCFCRIIRRKPFLIDLPPVELTVKPHFHRRCLGASSGVLGGGGGLRAAWEGHVQELQRQRPRQGRLLAHRAVIVGPFAAGGGGGGGGGDNAPLIPLPREAVLQPCHHLAVSITAAIEAIQRRHALRVIAKATRGIPATVRFRRIESVQEANGGFLPLGAGSSPGGNRRRAGISVDR